MALKPVASWGLVGGLHTDLPAPEIQDNACAACNNVVFDNGGRIIPRPGMSSILTSLAAGHSAYHFGKFKTLAGVEQRFTGDLKLSNGTVKLLKWTSPTFTDITGAVALTGTEDIAATDASFNGALYFTSGTGDLVTWDGVAASISTVKSLQATPALQPPLTPKFVIASPQGGHLFLMNYSQADGSGPIPYGISWSSLLNATLWNGGDAGLGSGFQFLADDDEPITGCTQFGQFVIAFKSRSTYIGSIVGYPKIWEFTRNQEDRGCVAQGSITPFNNMRLWLGDDNVYMMNQWGMIQSIGDSIITRFLSQTNPGLMNRSVAFVDRYQKMWHLFCPTVSGTTQGKLFTFDLQQGGWTESTIDTSINPVSAFTFRQGNWQDQFVIGDRSGKYFSFDYSSFTDGGATFLPSWSSKVFDAVKMSGGANEVMSIQKIAVHAVQGNVDVFVNHGDSFSSLASKKVGSMILDGLNPKYVVDRIDSRFAQVNLQWPTVSTAAPVEGLTIHIAPRVGEVR